MTTENCLAIEQIATKSFEDQKPGTSGLRKKTEVFESNENYLENFVQSIFNSVEIEERKDKTLLIAGDGRYYNSHAITQICRIAAANEVSRVWIGEHGLLSTPAASLVIREKEPGVCFGGIFLTASHNPGGPKNDVGVKFNDKSGAPAREDVTEKIFEHTKTIKTYKIVPDLPAPPLDKVGIAARHTVKRDDGSIAPFVVEVISTTDLFFEKMRTIFDFESIQKLLLRPDFTVVYDALHGVAAPYGQELFVKIFGCPAESVMHGVTLEDFGGLHPDPNLTYAAELVKKMGLTPNGEKLAGAVASEIPELGAAGDGDNDRYMILGKHFFVSPSDSLAIIAHYAQLCIPYFKKEGVVGLARSMPTSGAVDRVAAKLGVPLFEVPTGWKFFGSLMDAGKINICGEESFGTGSDHIREKDGLWAVLAWLSILAFVNTDAGKPLVTVQHVVEQFWKDYGRVLYCRYDYEEIDTAMAHKFLDHLTSLIAGNKNVFEKAGVTAGKVFDYTDPVNGSVSLNQGYIFANGADSRIVFRQSGTGSSGITIRIYFEQLTSQESSENASSLLLDFASNAVAAFQVKEFLGRDKPNVIT